MQEFGLRNSEGHKINKPLSGLLVYRRIMPSAERLSTTFTVALEASLFIFSHNLLAWGIILGYTSRRKGLIYQL